jgi:hypothetical protein
MSLLNPNEGAQESHQEFTNEDLVENGCNNQWGEEGGRW